MPLAYLITEQETDLAILKKLLPNTIASDLVFYATHGRSSVYSAAGTLLSDRSRPVVIVVDAETQNAAEIQEKISLANMLLLPAAPVGIPFKVLLVAPTIASILAYDSDTQAVQNVQPNLLEAVNPLTSSQIQALQQHPVIQELIEFLFSVVRQTA